MKTRLTLGGAFLLMLTIGIAFAVPASRYPLLGILRNERLHQGRPIHYWLAALKEADPSVRRQAALVLGDAGADKEQPLADAERSQIMTALIETLGDSDAFVRKCAATSFLMYSRDTPVSHDSTTIRRLIAALQDREAVVRQAAVRGLWQAGAVAKEAEGVQRLTEALADKDDFVRAYASRSLGRIGPDAKVAVPVLLSRLSQEEERDDRKLAAKALGLIGAKAIGSLLPDTVAALVEGLKNDARGLREYAARSLGQLSAKESLPALRQALKDRDEHVRTAAREAIQQIESADTKKAQ